jgi:hypothetical protein
VTTQREYIFTAPTYAAASATTITTAATLAITGAPVAGSNVTLTNRYAMLVDAGNSFGILLRSDTTDTVNGQLRFHNTNTSGVSGMSWYRADGTTWAGAIHYNDTARVIQFEASNENGIRFQGGGGQILSWYMGGSPNGYRAGFWQLPSAGSAVAVTNVGTLNENATLRLNYANPSDATLGAFQIWRSGGTQRYGFILTDTEHVSRIIGANGGQQNRGMLSESVTLSTAGATTDTTIQIPANSFVLGVTVRVTTGITGIDSTALEIGDATTSDRFGSIAAFTAGTTNVGLNHLQGGISTDAAGPIVTSATAVRLTLTGGTDDTPSAGAVRVTIHYISLTAPTS